MKWENQRVRERKREGEVYMTEEWRWMWLNGERRERERRNRIIGKLWMWLKRKKHPGYGTGARREIRSKLLEMYSDHYSLITSTYLNITTRLQCTTEPHNNFITKLIVHQFIRVILDTHLNRIIQFFIHFAQIYKKSRSYLHKFTNHMSYLLPS